MNYLRQLEVEAEKQLTAHRGVLRRVLGDL